MKSKFEKDLKAKAYASVPDKWEEIEKYAVKRTENANQKRKSPLIYIVAAACLCFSVVAAVFLNRSDLSGPEASKTTEGISHMTKEYDSGFFQDETDINKNEDTVTTPSEFQEDTDYDNWFNIPYVLWGDSSESELNLDFESGESNVLGKKVTLHHLLADKLKSADDVPEFALVVRVADGTDYAQKFPELVKARDTAKQELDKTAETCVQKYMDSRGVSYVEARAKMYSDPDFVKAREKHFAALEALESAILIERYENNKGAIEELKTCGITVSERDSEGRFLSSPADARNKDFQPCLSAYDAIAITVATKAEIYSLAEKELSFSYTFFLAPENADKYEYTDSYSYSEVVLCDDTNFSVKLSEAYKKSNGKPLRVEITIAYLGKEMTVEEIEAAAFEEIGMTPEEYYACATVNDVNRYRDAFNRLTYHTDYYEETASKLLKDKEVVKINPQGSAIVADLTYDRATQLLENEEVAYICLENENSSVSDSFIAEIEV